MFFVLLRSIFCEKLKIAPPYTKTAPPQTSELAKLDEKLVSISVKTFFFWRTLDFGRKKTLNFWFRPKNHSQFQWRPFFLGEHLILSGKNLWISDFRRKITLNFSEDLFYFFGEHLILGGKNLWISDFGRKITLNFSEDLFFFGEHLIFGGKNLWISELSEKFRLNFRTNRLKLIQVQWKFESRSFAQFSLFQNSPPPPPLFQILATRLAVNEYLSKYFMNWFLEYSNKKPAQLIFHDFIR